MQLDICDNMQWDIFVWRTWEEAETNAIESALRPGSVFYDVGSNIGYHSLIASRIVGPTGRVVAFEPMRCNIERLRRNLALNDAHNVTVVECGLSDSVTTAVAAMPRSEFGMASLRSLDGASFTQEIALETGDGIAARLQLPGPDVVKIDVEGAEYKALIGMRGLLRTASAIVIEVSPPYLEELGGSEAALREYLRDCGFTSSRVLSKVRCEDRKRVFTQTNELFSK